VSCVSLAEGLSQCVPRLTCKLAIGVIMPPKLHAKATPSSRLFPNLLPSCRSCRMGLSRLMHSTGAVWLLIHMLRNKPSSIIASKNSFGESAKIA